MLKKKFRFIMVLIVLGCLGAVSSCAPMQGHPSLTLLSRDITASSPNIKVLGEKDSESDTLTWCLLFMMFGSVQPNHEAALNRLLERHNADLLVDAEMTTMTIGVPYIFFQTRMTVEGIPAQFVKGDMK